MAPAPLSPGQPFSPVLPTLSYNPAEDFFDLGSQPSSQQAAGRRSDSKDDRISDRISECKSDSQNDRHSGQNRQAAGVKPTNGAPVWTSSPAWVFKSKGAGAYLAAQDDGSLVCSDTDHVKRDNVQFVVRPDARDDGVVTLQCCINNLYVSAVSVEGKRRMTEACVEMKKMEEGGPASRWKVSVAAGGGLIFVSGGKKTVASLGVNGEAVFLLQSLASGPAFEFEAVAVPAPPARKPRPPVWTSSPAWAFKNKGTGAYLAARDDGSLECSDTDPLKRDNVRFAVTPVQVAGVAGGRRRMW